MVARMASSIGLVADHAGVADGADVEPVLHGVVLGPVLPGGFADAVGGQRIEEGIVRGVFQRSTFPEYGDRAGVKNLVDSFLAGDFQHVEEGGHIDVPRPQRRSFAAGGEDGGKVVDLVDAVLTDDLRHPRFVRCVKNFKTPLEPEPGAQVGSNHVVVSVPGPQGRDEDAAQLVFQPPNTSDSITVQKL